MKCNAFTLELSARPQRSSAIPQEYGHRVRLASHAVYREFITNFGLEFYPLGGDPKVTTDRSAP